MASVRLYRDYLAHHAQAVADDAQSPPSPTGAAQQTAQPATLRVQPYIKGGATYVRF